MAKTKRYAKRSKSRKIKRGGRKTNNTALKVSQMVGGDIPAPAPAPASLLKLATLNEASVKEALQSFGDASLGLQDAVAQGVTTVNSLLDAVQSQKEALQSLQISANTMATSIAGVDGLYNRLVVSPFVQTPDPPAPRPAAA